MRKKTTKLNNKGDLKKNCKKNIFYEPSSFSNSMLDDGKYQVGNKIAQRTIYSTKKKTR